MNSATREQALRRLPFAIFAGNETARRRRRRRRDLRVVNVERAALDGFYRIAEAKLAAAQEATDNHHERFGTSQPHHV